MKRTITIIALITGFTLSTIAATNTVETPIQSAFADKLVEVFGGKDKSLSQAELVRVLGFLQANLPESTQPTSLANRLSRENNFYNAPRGELTEERFSVRDRAPELIVSDFIRKFDTDHDLKVDNNELAVALGNVIGTPKSRSTISGGGLAQK